MTIEDRKTTDSKTIHIMKRVASESIKFETNRLLRVIEDKVSTNICAAKVLNFTNFICTCITDSGFITLLYVECSYICT